MIQGVKINVPSDNFKVGKKVDNNKKSNGTNFNEFIKINSKEKREDKNNDNKKILENAVDKNRDSVDKNVNKESVKEVENLNEKAELVDVDKVVEDTNEDMTNEAIMQLITAIVVDLSALEVEALQVPENISDVEINIIEDANILKNAISTIIDAVKNVDNINEAEFNNILNENLQVINNLLGKDTLLNSNENVSELVNLMNSITGNSKELIKLLEEVPEVTKTLSHITKEINNLTNKIDDFSINKMPLEEEVKVVDISNSETKKEANEDEGLLKESKILKSIINDKENVIVNRFPVMNTEVNNGANITKPQAINSTTVVNDVIQTVKFMSNEGINELIVKINPRELGEMVISLIKDGDSMRAELKASSRETYSLLMRNVEDIKKYLGEQSFRVEQVQISLTNDSTEYREQSFLSGNGNENSNKGNEKNKGNYLGDSGEIIEDEEELLLSNINILA